ncbi:type IX secretion system membrane protein, PorP/SprF family [Chitinophaga costaii]|uniref:Type IX secretion system membrane protein, PorP/SprF family n=1 Tax=Chitinophaga costaii TaxID=1335309 RepID=A0A1C3Z4F7_9BACT|nr:PorP/SprF family type IX secretion system membrane protein [Chitinophaga costaii]PUZ30224.1 type IX secretion system membrane protein PorP/SprF [Chitinophaga costaii]SCB77172.1 type IX secretion system membrane protein, PorP/SprF family [Chitinophaga costaii]
MKKCSVAVFGAWLVGAVCYLPARAQQQQDPQYAQYMFNGIVINPAYGSMDESTSLTVVARDQWVGIAGAPKTAAFTFYTPVHESGTTIGFTGLTEKVIPVTQTAFNLHVSQRVMLNQHTYLALGLKVGMAQFSENDQQFNTTDPVYAKNITYMRTDVGFGFMLFTERFYLGLSSPSFQQFASSKTAEKTIYQRRWYLQGGYLFDMNDNLKFKPNVMLRQVYGNGIQFDLNANFLVKNVVWVGASYRSEKIVNGILQVQATKNLQVGYAYDFPMSDNLLGMQGGSHELMMNYRFSFSKWKVVAPRYF